MILSAALEISTWQNYSSACSSYMRFCTAFNVAVPLPPSATSLMAWLVVSRFVFDLAAKTSATYMTGLKTLCKIAGFETKAFDDPVVHYVLRGLKKTCKRRFKTRPRLPITVWLLASFASKLSESYEDRLTVAVLSVGVHGLLRAGEYIYKNGRISLPREKVTWFEDKVVLLIRSKTDTFKLGVEVTLWRNNSICCPWTRLRWIWENAPDKSFWAPLFQNGDGSPFTYVQLNASVKLLARTLHLDPDSFTTHSTRIGGATTLAILGFPAHIIKDIGRWKSLAYQLYPKVSGTQYREVCQAFGRAAASAADWFGGLPASRACELVWDDFSNVDLFAGSSVGSVGVQFN